MMTPAPAIDFAFKSAKTLLLLGTIVFSFLLLHIMTLCFSVNISEKIRESMEEIFKKGY